VYGYGFDSEGALQPKLKQTIDRMQQSSANRIVLQNIGLKGIPTGFNSDLTKKG